MSKTVLITGAAGFIGSHLVEHILKTTDWNVVGLDRLDETSTLARLDTDVRRKHPSRFRFVWHDLKAPINDSIDDALLGGNPSDNGCFDTIYHLAASTHVDRSIDDPTGFVLDNVIGTLNLLEWVKSLDIKTFLYMNTDEVYGPAAPGFAYHESDRHMPSNPYSASKSAAGMLCHAYANTYGTPIKQVFAMNVFGERQHPEKFLPLIVKKLLRGETIQIHADKTRTVPTSRFYIHARNVAAALLHVADHTDDASRLVNIAGEREVTSLELVAMVSKIADIPFKVELVDSVSHRPGHDMRYALSGHVLFDVLGFQYPKTFAQSLEKTVNWYLSHQDWLGL